MLIHRDKCVNNPSWFVSKRPKMRAFFLSFFTLKIEKTCHLLVLVWTTLKKVYIANETGSNLFSWAWSPYYLELFLSQYVHKTITKHLMHTSNDVFERSTAAFLKSCPVSCLLVNWIQKTPLLSTQLKSRSQAIRNHGVTSNWLSQGEQAFTLRSMTKMYVLWILRASGAISFTEKS